MGKTKMTYTKNCAACGDEFDTQNKDKTTCSVYCRRELSKPKQGLSAFGRRPIKGLASRKEGGE